MSEPNVIRFRSHTMPQFPRRCRAASASVAGCCLLALLCSVLPSTNGADLKPLAPTGWSSFRHDLAQTGVATSPLPDKLELLWEVTLGEQVVATAAIVGEFVYVPCLSGELFCLKRQTG